MSHAPGSAFFASCMVFLAAACSGRPLSSDGSGAAEGTGTASGEESGATATSGGPGPSGGSSSSGGSGSSGGGGNASSSDGDSASATTAHDDGCFACPPDFSGDGGGYCDTWVEDCPQGYKCMPWAEDGGNAWNATKCAPIAPEPKALGEACTVEGTKTSGIDDCDLHAMCWNVDEDGRGTCRAMCTGTPSEPSCAAEDEVCLLTSDGVLTLCFPRCDPLIQDCADGEICLHTVLDFSCIPGSPGTGPGAGGYGAPCEFVNACERGLFCAASEQVPGCTSDTGCCSQFCDLGAPPGAAQCSGVADGQVCLPWYTDGSAPAGYEDVGYCGVTP